jgi:hypothetical protein
MHRRLSRDLNKYRTVGLILALCAAISVSAITTPTIEAASIYPAGSSGADVSWPEANCNVSPPSEAAFGIVGVTGGLDFTRNTCLFREAHWFNHLSLYMNTGYPGVKYVRKVAGYPWGCRHDNDSCLAYSYGFDAAQYGLLYAASQNVHSTVWWLDVETENSWTPNKRDNRQAIQGMIDAIRQSIILPTIGIYSTPKQWRVITGGWRNGFSNWVGTGSAKRSVATAACQGSDFTAGGTVLTQYVLKLDHDYVCKRN